MSILFRMPVFAKKQTFSGQRQSRLGSRCNFPSTSSGAMQIASAKTFCQTGHTVTLNIYARFI